jgi:ankyrin repeat protein
VQEGNTALHKATEGGHIDTVVELLQAGADPTLHNKVELLPAPKLLTAIALMPPTP